MFHPYSRALLQRMSTILTEPVKDTVKDYEEMKKLIVPRSLGIVSCDRWTNGSDISNNIMAFREFELV